MIVVTTVEGRDNALIKARRALEETHIAQEFEAVAMRGGVALREKLSTVRAYWAKLEGKMINHEVALEN
ncbi:hypothetical protein ACLOJK_038331 [Asimina triloba]